MSLPLTMLHRLRLLQQVSAVLIQLQLDIRRDARAWQQLVVRRKRVGLIAEDMMRAADGYLARLQVLADYRATSPNWAGIMTLYTVLGGTEAELLNYYQALKTGAEWLLTAPRGSWSEITTTCATILINTNPPEAIWPD